MKRLLPYIILAFALHAIALSADTSWLVQPPGTRVASKSITLTISSGSHSPQGGAKAAEGQNTPKPSPAQTKKVSQKPPDADPLAARPVDTKPGVSEPTMAAAKSENTMIKVAPHQKAAKPERKLPPKRSKPKPAPEKQAPPNQRTAPQASTSKPQLPSNLPTRQTTTPKADGRAASAMASQDGPESLMRSALGAAVKNNFDENGLPSSPAVKDAVPMYQINPPPYYPRSARRLGLEGQVMLKVLINVGGQVDDLTVVASSGHKILDRAALSAVRKWRFEPGTEDGEKKAMWVKIPINFDLK